MEIKEINLGELKKIKQIYYKKHFSYLLDPLYIKFFELYYKTTFENKSIVINGDSLIYIPMTLNPQNNEYSFFGKPIEIFSDNHISKKDYLKIQHYLKKLKTNNLFKFEIKKEQDFVSLKKNFIEQIIDEMYIDLSKSIEQIKSNFSSNTRNEIEKKYEDVKFEIIDKKNYKLNEIFEMMNFHLKISGKQTRSKESWKQNEEMILDDKGFLIKVTYQNKLISLSFFYYNQIICRYYSSVADREYFKKVRNIHHRSIWLAINYVKDKSKYFFVGPKTIFSKKIQSEKERNIEKFKSKFKGFETKFMILNHIPDYDFYEKFITDIN